MCENDTSLRDWLFPVASLPELLRASHDDSIGLAFNHLYGSPCVDEFTLGNCVHQRLAKTNLTDGVKLAYARSTFAEVCDSQMRIRHSEPGGVV